MLVVVLVMFAGENGEGKFWGEKGGYIFRGEAHGLAELESEDESKEGEVGMGLKRRAEILCVFASAWAGDRGKSTDIQRRWSIGQGY